MIYNCFISDFNGKTEEFRNKYYILFYNVDSGIAMIQPTVYRWTQTVRY